MSLDLAISDEKMFPLKHLQHNAVSIVSANRKCCFKEFSSPEWHPLPTQEPLTNCREKPTQKTQQPWHDFRTKQFRTSADSYQYSQPWKKKKKISLLLGKSLGLRDGCCWQACPHQYRTEVTPMLLSQTWHFEVIHPCNTPWQEKASSGIKGFHTAMTRSCTQAGK